MNRNETALLATFKTVAAFGTKYATDFPAVTVGGQQFALVTAAITATAALGATQVSGSEQTDSGNLAKAAARLHLHDDIAAITDAAHSLILLGNATLAGKFQLPHSNGDQALLNTARAFITDATPLLATFQTVGLPASFLTTLTADIAALEAANTLRGTGQTTQGGATGGLEDTTHKAAVALHILDTIVKNTYKTNPVKLAEWVIASHVEKHTPVPRPPKTTPPPTP